MFGIWIKQITNSCFKAVTQEIVKLWFDAIVIFLSIATTWMNQDLILEIASHLEL